VSVAFVVLAVLLGLATAANLLFTFAVIRRLRALEERGGPASAAPALPAVGSAVGEFTVLTTGNERLGRSSVSTGQVLVGFVSVGCAPCRALVEEVAAGTLAVDGRCLFLVSGDSSIEAARMAEVLSELGPAAIVTDQPEVAAAFGGVNAYPTLLRLDEGVIVAAGHELAAVQPALEGV
jgi:thiol-disulfide isomerase/thioredoxin